MAGFQRLIKRVKARWGPALQSDTAFIEAAFREILGRNPDLDGLTHYRRVLREGLGRTAVLLDIMRSEEFTATLVKSSPSLPDLRVIRPEKYRKTIDRTSGETITVFDATSPADFDWLETAILQYGYYEKPGVWDLRIDTDKRVAAEIVASFRPEQALELGCASGAILDSLHDHGVMAEGVEISAMALARASERVRGRIHQGDLLSLELKSGYDLVFGLDVFEHLNPNRIDQYVQRLGGITRPGAWLFCNIPAFGEDPVFGTVFPFYVDDWERDRAAGRPFATLHVDELGYPIHGHLTWAEARWWTAQFEAGGFQRETDIERALHAKYDAYMEKRSPARKSFFVFSHRASDERRSAILGRIRSERSAVLGHGE